MPLPAMEEALQGMNPFTKLKPFQSEINE